MSINISNLNKSFNGHDVLKGINLNIEDGESYVLIGGSGHGKSVLLKSIIGLITPDSGTIMLHGDDVTNKHISRRTNFSKECGVLFQGSALFDSLNIAENICFGLVQSGKININSIYDVATIYLERVGLSYDTCMLYPSQLSGGMQKRVAFARAISGSPKTIFLDEPTSGLDPVMTKIISELIKSVSSDYGHTTFTITHDMGCARNIANTTGMIYEGKIIWEGKNVDECTNKYVLNFIN